MHDWILGLRKAAIEHRGGVGASEWADAETELESVAPDELRELYLDMSGATFASGVLLYPLTDAGDPRGLVAQSRSGSAGFPSEDVWRFGGKQNQHLAAIRKARLGEIDGAEPAMPEWLEELPDDEWVYVAFDEENHELQVFRTLENLLSSVIPAAEAEEAGQGVLARGRTLVEAAVTELGALGSAAIATIARVTKTGKRAKKKKARPTAKKKAAAPKKRAAKRKPARKVSGTTSRRKTSKNKPTRKRR